MGHGWIATGPAAGLGRAHSQRKPGRPSFAEGQAWRPFLKWVQLVSGQQSLIVGTCTVASRRPAEYPKYVIDKGPVAVAVPFSSRRQRLVLVHLDAYSLVLRAEASCKTNA